MFFDIPDRMCGSKKNPLERLMGGALGSIEKKFLENLKLDRG
jgi:hypothetical protein